MSALVVALCIAVGIIAGYFLLVSLQNKYPDAWWLNLKLNSSGSCFNLHYWLLAMILITVLLLGSVLACGKLTWPVALILGFLTGIGARSVYSLGKGATIFTTTC